MKHANASINALGVLLAAVAIGFGGFAWAEGPRRTLDRPPIVHLFEDQNGELVPLPVPAPTPSPSASPISGETAFWSGVSAVLIVLVNGLLAAWTKRLDSNARVDALEIRLLKQAAVDKAANDEIVRLALGKADHAADLFQQALDAQAAASAIRDLKLGRLEPGGAGATQ